MNFIAPGDRGGIVLNAGAMIEFTDLFAAIVNGGHDVPAEEPTLDVEPVVAKNVAHNVIDGRVQP